jgi:hypothetical protein
MVTPELAAVFEGRGIPLIPLESALACSSTS